MNCARALLFAWASFCLALVPVMGFTDTGYMQYSLVADHYQHLAIVAVVTLLAAAWSSWRGQLHKAFRFMPVVMASLVVALFGFAAWQQNRLYADAITLYRATLEKNPTSWVARNNLADALVEKGELQEAIAMYQQALKHWPDYGMAHNNLVDALVEKGQLPDAVKQSQETLHAGPSTPTRTSPWATQC